MDRQDRPEYYVGLSTENLEMVCLSSRQGLSSRPLGESGYNSSKMHLTGQEIMMSKGISSKLRSNLS